MANAAILAQDRLATNFSQPTAQFVETVALQGLQGVLTLTDFVLAARGAKEFVDPELIDKCGLNLWCLFD